MSETRRNPWVKVILISGSIFLVIWIGFYYLLTDIGRMASLEPQLRKEALDRGFYTTTEAYLKSIQVPEDQNAAEELTPLLVHFGTDNYSRRSDADFMKYVESRDSLFEKLERVGTKPYCVFKRDYSKFPVINFANLASMTSASVMLSRRAALLRKAGKPEAAIRSWKAAATLAIYMDDEHISRGVMGRFACISEVTDSIKDEISRSKPNPKEAALMLDAIEPLREPMDMRAWLRSTYWRMGFEYDTFEYSVSGRMGIPSKVWKKVPRFKEAALAVMHQSFIAYDKNLRDNDVRSADLAGRAAMEVFLPRGETGHFMRTSNLQGNYAASVFAKDFDVRRDLFDRLSQLSGKPSKELVGGGSGTP